MDEFSSFGEQMDFDTTVNADEYEPMAIAEKRVSPEVGGLDVGMWWDGWDCGLWGLWIVVGGRRPRTMQTHHPRK